MAKFKVTHHLNRDIDWEADESELFTTACFSAEEAAEEYVDLEMDVEEDFHGSSNPTVLVYNVDTKKVIKVSVEIDWVPSFSGTIIEN
jgi:hypothetical protein